MILIEHILGNAKKDPVWKQKLEGANVDLLVLDQREAQKAAAGAPVSAVSTWVSHWNATWCCPTAMY